MKYIVTLFNHHAACGIRGEGPSLKAGFRNAMTKAGPSFTRYRTDHSVLTDEPFAALFAYACASRRRNRYGRVHIAHDGLGVEIYKHNPADSSY